MARCGAPDPTLPGVPKKIMAKTPSLFLANLFLLLSCSARAEFYTCKDNAGHVISSDRPIPECADKSTQVFKANGSLKGQLAAPPTPEQRKAAEIQEQQRQKEAQHQENLRREQLFLVAHYPNEDAIEAARKRELDAIAVKITAETRNIATATATLENKNPTVVPAIYTTHHLQNIRSPKALII